MVKSAINFLFENSIFLIVGAIVALVWANTDNETYKALLHSTALREWLLLRP